MKKIKLNDLLELLSVYSDKLVDKKEKKYTIDDEVYHRIQEKVTQKHNIITWKKIRFALSISSLIIILLIYYITSLKNRQIPLSYFHGQVYINNKKINTKDINKFKIYKNMIIKTDVKGSIIISKKDKNNHLLIKMGEKSSIKIDKIKLYSMMKLSFDQGVLFFSVDTKREHTIEFIIDDYNMFLKGSKIYFEKSGNNIMILLLEGVLNIYQKKKLLTKIIQGEKIDSIQGKLRIQKLKSSDYNKVNNFIKKPDSLINNRQSNRRNKLKINLGNNNFFHYNNRFFTIHNQHRDLYIFKNRTGELIKHTQIPYRSKSIPVLINNNLYIGTLDKKLNIYNINKNKWSSILEIGDLSYSGAFYYKQYIYILNSDGYLYKINNNKIEKKIQTGIPVWSEGLIDNNILYIGTLNQRVYCYDLNKETIIWQSLLKSNVINFKPILINHILIIKTAKGKIFGINKNTGRKLWNIKSTSNSFLKNKNSILFLIKKSGLIQKIDYKTGDILKQYQSKNNISKVIILNETILLVLTEKGVLYQNNLYPNFSYKYLRRVKDIFWTPSFQFYYIYTLDKYLEKCQINNNIL